METKREYAVRKIDEIGRITANAKNVSPLVFLADAVVWLLKDRIEQLTKEAADESK